MTLLYFARHGETDDNAQRVFQGHGGKALNAKGRFQAGLLAKRVQRLSVDAVVSSDLERAVETAAIVASACGVARTEDVDFREINVGEWTGKSHIEIAKCFPDEWSAWCEGRDVRRGGGETYAELIARITRAVVRIAPENTSDRKVLVVSHGGAIKRYVAHVLGLADEHARALASLRNASLTLVDRDDEGRMQLHSWNDVAHLEPT
jgi:probable phosphoglycerate mutase